MPLWTLETPLYLPIGKRACDAESAAGIDRDRMRFGGSNGMSVETELANRQEHNSPKSAPACRRPANGNKHPHGTMSLLRPLIAIGPGCPTSVEARPIVSCSGPGLAFSLFALASDQRAAESVARVPLDSTSARQKRRTSLVL